MDALPGGKDVLLSTEGFADLYNLVRCDFHGSRLFHDCFGTALALFCDRFGPIMLNSTAGPPSFHGSSTRKAIRSPPTRLTMPSYVGNTYGP